jgi:Rod binding domain-containing protein
MNAISAIGGTTSAANITGASPPAPAGNATDDPKFIEAFNTFVGETFYGTMLKSMRNTVGKVPYFNGGRAEEIFTRQFDQVLAEKLGKTRSQGISEPMLKLYQLQRT